jgi:MtN3 and saliva related transmembrane protein
MHDISRRMYLSYTSGIFLWLVYGVMLGNWPIIVSNAITFLFAATILLLKLRHG